MGEKADSNSDVVLQAEHNFDSCVCVSVGSRAMQMEPAGEEEICNAKRGLGFEGVARKGGKREMVPAWGHGDRQMRERRRANILYSIKVKLKIHTNSHGVLQE